MRFLGVLLCLSCTVGAQEGSFAKVVDAIRDGDLDAARRALPARPEFLTLPEYAALSYLDREAIAYLRPLIRVPDTGAPLVRQIQAIARELASADLDDQRRADIVAAVQRLGAPAVPALIAVLKAPHPRTVREAARLLGTLGDARAIAPLSAALDHGTGGAESKRIIEHAVEECASGVYAHERGLDTADRYLLLATRYLTQVDLDRESYRWSWDDGLTARPVDPLLYPADRAEDAARMSERLRPRPAASGVRLRAAVLRHLLMTALGKRAASLAAAPEAIDQALCPDVGALPIPPPSFPVHAAILENIPHAREPRKMVAGVVASLWSPSGLVRTRAIEAARRLSAKLSGDAQSLPFALPEGEPDAFAAARELLLAADLDADEAARVQRALQLLLDRGNEAVALGPTATEPPPEFGDPLTQEAAEPTKVVVFYGTDRAMFMPDFAFYAIGFVWGAIAALLALVLPRVIRWTLREHLQVLTPITRWIGWSAAVVLTVSAAYGSARVHLKHERLGFEYGGERGPFDDAAGPYCHLGTCVVGIPPGHLSGEVERPQPLKGDFWEDPDRHVVLLSIRPEGDSARFFGQVRERAEEGGNSAFVFVHGFNVTFEDAALRTAQMTHDLNFQGAPIFFSWPSRGSLLGYTADESTVAWATRHLKRFLRDVRRKLPTATIHLVAHSMGNRALTEALRRLAREIEHEGLPRFQEVVLAAPDIDGATFRNDIAPAIRTTAERVTLYASSTDDALLASKTVHGYPRAGDSGELIIVVDGVETIDVSANINSSVLGHSYYGSVGRVLDDLIALLRKRRMPKERGLAEVLSKGGVHWRLE